VGENNPINDRDEVTGWLDTGIRDPSGENFCGVAEQAICLPFVWRHGTITELPIPSGRNAVANAINNRGEIVGMGEHGAPDHICPAPQLLHFAAILWSAKGVAKELPAFPGDLDASAAGINDEGDVAGASGSCTLQPVRAVIWHNGVMRVLPNLGGTGFNIAFALNNKGDAVGQSDLPGDLTHHAALWRDGTVADLGTLYGLPVSLANAVNNRDDVVGFSQDLDNTVFVAELWENGRTWDLNTLIPQNSGLYLLEALGINNKGQIAGYAFNFAANDLHGFLASPVNNGRAASSPAHLTQAQRELIRTKLRMYSKHVLWPRSTNRPQLFGR
jgi:probable HAF family extracellular repeat protein